MVTGELKQRQRRWLRKRHLKSEFALLKSKFALLKSEFALLKSKFALLKSEFALLKSEFASIPSRLILRMLPNFFEADSKGLYQSPAKKKGKLLSCVSVIDKSWN